MAAVLEEERSLQQHTLSVNEIKARIEALKKPTALYEMITSKIESFGLSSDSDVDPDSEEEEEDFRDMEEEVDVDLNRTVVLASKITEEQDISEDEAGLLDLQQRLVKSFMSLLLTYSNESITKAAVLCQQCADNPCRLKEEQVKD